MADEDPLGAEMKDLTATSFGYLIAFLLPGVFGLYALSAWLPEAGERLQPILKADATVGPSIVGGAPTCSKIGASVPWRCWILVSL